MFVSWTSGKKHTFLIDQKMLCLFKLTPRVSDNCLYWDDLSTPMFDVVINKPVSTYDYPNQTEASVKVKKDYLEDYVYLRKKTAIQVFQIIKEIPIDN